METNIIYNEDCLETMSNHIEEHSVDIVLTSPPRKTHTLLDTTHTVMVYLTRSIYLSFVRYSTDIIGF